MPITSTPIFTGIEYINRPFSYTFSSTNTDYPKTIQFTDSSPGLLSSTSGDTFASATGFQGSPGPAGTLVVDNIVSNSFYVNTYAGSTVGFTDGNVSNAQFDGLGQMIKDNYGNRYVADTNNFAIRKITPDGTVSTLCILPVQPIGICYVPTFADSLFCTTRSAIYVISPDGNNGIILGSPDSTGLADGALFDARFRNPTGIILDDQVFALWVADTGNNVIRKCTYNPLLQEWSVTTVVGEPGGQPGYQDEPQVPISNMINISTVGTTFLFQNTVPNSNTYRYSYSLNNESVGLAYDPSSNIWISVANNVSSANLSSNYGYSWSGTNSTGLYDIRGVAYNNGVAVAVGRNNSTTNAAISYSQYDYSNWTRISTPINGTLMSNIRVLSNTLIAMGSTNLTDGTGITGAYSTNGSNWTGINGFAGSTTGIINETPRSGRDVAWNGSNRWVSVGTNGNISTATSLTGTWSAVSGFAITRVYSVDYGNGLWVIGGSSNGVGRIQYSSNLTSWSNGTFDRTISTVYRVRYISGMWLLGEYSDRPGGILQDISGYVMAATHPSNWTTMTSVNTPRPPSYDGKNYGVLDFTVGPMRYGGFLNGPTSIIDDAVNLYITDTNNNRIRQFNKTTSNLITIAGNGVASSIDGTLTTGSLNGPYDILRVGNSNYYVSELYGNKIRLVSLNSNTITTYAGTGIQSVQDGPYFPNANMSPRFLSYLGSSNKLYFTDYNPFDPNSSRIRFILRTLPTEVRPSGTRPPGYVIIDTSSYAVNVLARMDVSTNAINNTFQLYKYEPFSGNTFTILSGFDTISSTRSSSQLLPFLTTTSNSITFSSSNGFQSSYQNLSLIIDALSNGNIIQTSSNIVTVAPGRFFPPISNTAYTLYKNQTFTPIRFSTVLPVSTPISSPSLPPGLSFVQINSNTYDLSGIPLLEIPNSNYLIIGSNAGRIVTTTVSIVVNGERVALDVSGTLNYTGLTQDVSLNPTTTITATYPIGSAIRYTWSPALLPGLKFTDSTGSEQSGTSIFPTDLSGSITLSGAPNSNAIQILSASEVTSYSTTVTATRFTPLPVITSTKTFTFNFNPVVYFNNVSTPTIFTGITVPSNSIYFEAETALTTSNIPINDIFLVSGSLPDGLALTFSYADSRAYINGTPSTTVSPQFTLRASNALGLTQDYTTTLTIVNDSVSFTSPLVDACYNFIQFKPISNITPGRYIYPIQFTAFAASSCNVTMTTSDLIGTGLSLVSVGSNTYQLSGTPVTSKALTTLNVTATAAVSGATATNNKVQYSISGDVITLDTQTITGIQNRAITPVQFSGSTLSGRPIVSYSSSNLPSALTLSSTGSLSGIPRVTGTGSFTVNASTGYSSGSGNFTYDLSSDSILLVGPPSNAYPLTLNEAVPPIQITGISYSGDTVSNYRLSNLDSIYGITIGSNTGIFGGTYSNYPLFDSIPFQAYGSIGLVDSSLGFNLVTLSSNFLSVSYLFDNFFNLILHSTNNQVSYTTQSLYHSDRSIQAVNNYGLRYVIPEDKTLLLTVTNLDDLTNALLINLSNTPTLLRLTDLSSFSPTVITFGSSNGQLLTSIANVSNTSNWWASGGRFYDYDSNDNLILPDDPSIHVYNSTDDGLTWTELPPVLDQSGSPLWKRNAYYTIFNNMSHFGGGSILKYKSGVLLLGGSAYSDSPLFRSTDNGVTWNRVYTSFPPSGEGYRSMISDMNVEHPTIWVAAGIDFSDDYYFNNYNSNILQYSIDLGETWQNCTGNFSELDFETIGDKIASIVYASNTWLTVFKENNRKLMFSKDGSNWTFCDLSTDPLLRSIDSPSPVYFDGSNFKVIAIYDGTTPYMCTCSPTSDLSYDSWTFEPMNLTNGFYSTITCAVPPIPVTSGEKSSTIYVNSYPPGPTFTSPSSTSFVFNQYAPIPTITFSSIGTGTVYYFLDASTLPVGLHFDPITSKITGSPTQVGTTSITVYGKDDSGVTPLTLTFTVIIPRIIRQQTSASAYTSMVRQYTLVNAAQNARGNRVLTEDGKQGEFMAPMGTDNLIPNNCFICDPNVTSNANI